MEFVCLFVCFNFVLYLDRFFLQLGHPHHWHGTGWYFRPRPPFPVQKLSGIDGFGQSQQRGFRGRVWEHGAMMPLRFPPHTFTTPLFSAGWCPKREISNKNHRRHQQHHQGAQVLHFMLNMFLFFSFCLIWFTCNIAFKVKREAVNRLLGGTSVSFCCGCSSPVLHVCPANAPSPSLTSLLPFSFLRGWQKE